MIDPARQSLPPSFAPPPPPAGADTNRRTTAKTLTSRRSTVLGNLPSPKSQDLNSALHYHHSRVHQTRLLLITSSSLFMSLTTSYCPTIWSDPNWPRPWPHARPRLRLGFELAHCAPPADRRMQKFLEACSPYPVWSSLFLVWTNSKLFSSVYYHSGNTLKAFSTLDWDETCYLIIFGHFRWSNKVILKIWR